MNPNHQRQGSKGRSTVLKVVLLGDGGVGKSCIMNRFVSNDFEDQSMHTIGVEFLNKDLELNGEMYTLQIWDTAGQERFKSLRTPFYRGSDMCMLTYAVDDEQSFENLNTWKREFLHYADVKPDFPFMIIGNKIDLERKISIEQAEEWCKENGNLPYVETSAKTATNIEQAFVKALNRWADETVQERVPLPDSVQLGRSSNSTRICSGCS